MEISGNSKHLHQNVSKDAQQEPIQTTQAAQKRTTAATSTNSNSSARKKPPAEGTIHVLTTSNGSPYQSTSRNIHQHTIFLTSLSSHIIELPAIIFPFFSSYKLFSSLFLYRLSNAHCIRHVPTHQKHARW